MEWNEKRDIHTLRVGRIEITVNLHVRWGDEYVWRCVQIGITEATGLGTSDLNTAKAEAVRRFRAHVAALNAAVEALDAG